MKSRILIILPTYNEAGYISKLLSEISDLSLELSEQYDITVLNIDDSSPDGTAALAKNMNLLNFHQFVNSKKIGLGPAYLSGFHWGLTQNFDFFVQMDSDGSHLVSELPKLIQESINYDLVIGTRWMTGGSIANWSKHRILLSKFGTRYASMALELPFDDLTSGYRILSRNFLNSLDLKSISTRGYGFQIEIAFQAYINGFSIGQVPITFIERSSGKSKMTLGIALEAFKYVTWRGFGLRLSVNNRR